MVRQLTEEWRCRISAAIKEIQQYLKLENWEINISDDNTDAILEVKSIEGRYIAYIAIGEDFFKCDPKEKTKYIIHELVHLPQHRIIYQLRTITTDKCVEDITKLELEYITDWLSTFLVEYIPIPDSLKEE